MRPNLNVRLVKQKNFETKVQPDDGLDRGGTIAAAIPVLMEDILN